MLRIAMKTVDVISGQHFVTLAESFQNSRHYHQITGTPVINADVGFHIAMFGKPDFPHGVRTQAERGEACARWARVCSKEPYFMGWHRCAYIEIKVRQAGLKDRWNRPDIRAVDPVAAFNTCLYDWVC